MSVNSMEPAFEEPNIPFEELLSSIELEKAKAQLAERIAESAGMFFIEGFALETGLKRGVFELEDAKPETGFMRTLLGKMLGTSSDVPRKDRRTADRKYKTAGNLMDLTLQLRYEALQLHNFNQANRLS